MTKMNQTQKNNASSHTMPQRWLLLDLHELAMLFRQYYLPHDGYPGLKCAGDRLPPNLDEQCLELRQQIMATQDEYVQLLKYEKNPSTQMVEAEDLLDDLIAALEWYVVSREQEEGTHGCIEAYQMKQDYNEEDLSSPEKMARTLFEYATLASDIRSEISDIGGFTAETIDRAFEVADNLVDIKAKTVPQTDDAQRLLAKKRHYIQQAIAKIELIRSAANLVFRRYPEIVKQFNSRRVPIQNVAEYRSKRLARVYDRKPNKKNIPLRFLPQSISP